MKQQEMKFGPELLDLSGIWQFEMSSMEEAAFFDDTAFLPGSMDENGKGIDNKESVSPHSLNRDYLYTGAACYRRKISIPESFKEKRIVLFLERTKKTRVWVDGRRATPLRGSGQLKSYTTPHEYDLTPLLKAGRKHMLTIEVDNSREGMPAAMYDTFEPDLAWGHQISEYTQTNWNGIIGKLELRAYPPVYVSECTIRPQVAQKQAIVRLTITRPECGQAEEGTVTLSAHSFHRDGPCHIPGAISIPFLIEAGKTQAELTLCYPMGDDFLLWDEFSPALYRMELFLSCRKGCYRSCETFGMREFKTIDFGDGRKQFQINGRTVLLRGEINCALFPVTGYPPTDLESWLRVMKIYREYGMNHVRFHSWIPPRAAFTAADMLGLYVLFELPQWGLKMFGDVDKGDQRDADYFKEDVKRIFGEYLNSPSAVMMTFGNELRPGFYYYEEFLQYCKALEPDLLYSDIAGHSAYSEHVDFGATVPKFGGEYLNFLTCGTDWDYAEAVNRTPLPFIAHEAGQYQTYPDFEKDIAKYEEKQTVLKPRNLTYFHKISQRGGMSRLAADFHMASGRLSAMLYRYGTESYLRTPGCAGFHLLGLQDFTGQGTALIGVLDAFLEAKNNGLTPARLRESCSELTVLGRIPKFVWTEGEHFEAGAVVANYGPSSFTSTVSWRLEDKNGEILCSGTLSKKMYSQGEISEAGRIRVSLDEAETARMLTLKLCIDHMPACTYSEGANAYSIWVYPKQQPAAPEGLHIYSDMSEQAALDLETGKSVLIVSIGGKRALPHSREVEFRPNFWSPMFHSAENDGYGLGCRIDSTHPVFQEFPTDVFADWQWYDLINGARAIRINGAPESLRPIVQPIPTIELDNRLALLLEAQVGTGKLMVCTIDLFHNRSASAKQLFTSICSYIASERFHPTEKISLAFLKKLLPSREIQGLTLRVTDHMPLGGSTQAEAIPLDAAHRPAALPETCVLRWKSSTPEVAKVDSEGRITALTGGAVKITASLILDSEEELEAEAVILVGAPSARPLPLSFMESRSAGDCLVAKLDSVHTLSALSLSPLSDSIEARSMEATVFTSLDGSDYAQAAQFTIHTNAVSFAAFAQTSARFVKICTSSATTSNSLSDLSLTLYAEPFLLSIEPAGSASVLYETTPADVFSSGLLPELARALLTDGTRLTLPVCWTLPGYHEAIPGTYTAEGTVFHPTAANPQNLKAQFLVTVQPKNTQAADRTRLNQTLTQLPSVKPDNCTHETWRRFLMVRQEAVNFNALTSATQHDADRMLQKLEKAAALLGSENTGKEP